MDKKVKNELALALIKQEAEKKHEADKQHRLLKHYANTQQKRKLANIKRLINSNLDIVHKGDLLFLNDTLILCECKTGYREWKFSNPWLPDIILTESEIIRYCRF